MAKGIAAQFDNHTLVPGVIKPRSGTYRLRGSVSLDPGKCFTLTLFGAELPQFTLKKDVDSVENILTIKRSEQVVGNQKLPNFASDYRIAVGNSAAIYIDIFVDNGMSELCLDDGVIWATTLLFPDDVGGAVVFSSQI